MVKPGNYSSHDFFVVWTLGFLCITMASDEKPVKSYFITGCSNILLDLLPVLFKAELSIDWRLDTTLYHCVVGRAHEIGHWEPLHMWVCHDFVLDALICTIAPCLHCRKPESTIGRQKLFWKKSHFWFPWQGHASGDQKISRDDQERNDLIRANCGHVTSLKKSENCNKFSTFQRLTTPYYVCVNPCFNETHNSRKGEGSGLNGVYRLLFGVGLIVGRSNLVF